MAILKTDTGRIVLANAEYVHITPWTNEDTIGTDTIDVTNIVGDTLSFTPDDNTVNAKESEFKDDPLFENIVLGKYQFAATCIDFQNVVMEKIYGWKKDSGGNVYAPTGYKDIYATIEVGFRNEDVVVVAPKIKMNSKATIGNLKTGTGEGQLAGTAYAAKVNDSDTTLGILKSEAEGTAYTIKDGTGAKNFKTGQGVQAGG